MERLERLRDRSVAQIKVILKFAETINKDTSSDAINVRLEELANRYKEFNKHEIELFVFDNYKPVTELTDELYFKARTLLTQAGSKLEAIKNTPDLNVTLENLMGQQRTFYEGINSSSQVRLPKVNIEPFSGDYKYWASFKDLYLTTVDTKTNLSNVHKLQILNSLLKGEAASLIRHISITEANYDEAWDKLYNRYNKINPIVTAYIQSFLDQRPCLQANGKDLRRLTEQADEAIRGLRALGSEAEKRDHWLIYILLMKLDNETKQMWAKESVDEDFPTFASFLKFLNGRCDALEMCEATTKRPSNSVKTVKTFFSKTDAPVMYTCLICDNPHPVYKCPTFKNMNIEARSNAIITHNLCRNCLRRGHTSNKCFNKSSCLICSQRHHTLLHCSQPNNSANPIHSSTSHNVFSNDSNTLNIESNSQQSVSTSDPNQTTVLHTLHSEYDTVLPTALVYVKSRSGKLQLARILLDSGSQMSFVTESCVQSLGLKRSHSCISIHGLASTTAGITRGKTDMTSIISRINKQYFIDITAHIIKTVTNTYPIRGHQSSHIEALKNFELADPDYNNYKTIDILLGAEAFFEVLKQENYKIPGLPVLQNSKFGWLIAGTLTSGLPTATNYHSSVNRDAGTNHEEDIVQILKRFWEIEEIPNHLQADNSENYCESFYNTTTTRDINGRFCVRLPFKEPRAELGNSWHPAQRRLAAMEKKFHTSPEFFKDYRDFLKEYIQLGHMSPISLSEIPNNDDAKYFIPHHAVMKSTSSTTKLRVVFDASCKSSTSVSLNDILHVGPNIQRDLATIVLRFRKPLIALVSDVEKMYRQINIHPSDTNHHLILWRENPKDHIQIFKLNTVTYGTACAPFLAVRSLKKSTENFETLYPKACHIIQNDFYIDDLLTGCHTLEEALVLKDQLCQILGSAGFNLRKWKSNSPEFMKSFSKQEMEMVPKLIEDDFSVKTLGIMWNAETDIFMFKVQRVEEDSHWTKRRMLSAASKLYDPLGWLAPTTVLCKIILQKLWLLNIDWDTNLPDSIIKLWKSVYNNMYSLEEIKIPRCLTNLKNPISIQLHAFCDASEAAYGSVLYLRAVDQFGNISINIIYAKSKVAPIKQISLPRLELCGAVLLCKLVRFCMQALEYSDINIYAWTDSMIVLHWLSDVPRRWKSFIANRTSQILEIVPRSCWSHVESKQNPADYISKGVKPQLMSELKLWWKGPDWLSKTEDSWPNPKQPPASHDDVYLEERPKFVKVLLETQATEDVITQLVSRTSSWFKIRKTRAYVLRFGKPKSSVQEKSNRSITPTELSEAEKIIIRNIQNTAFQFELSVIRKGISLADNHKLSSLDPFIDSSGLLRVGGRLRNSPLNYTTKHPVILPKDHPINELIIRETHISNMHASNSLVLSIIRQQYWMIGARYSIKRIIKKCIICLRFRNIKNEQKMGDLPSVRCNYTRPFSKTGLDYAGPVLIKSSKRKNSPSEKAYIALFVCLSIKAVHLEVVSSLSSDSFLAALKRFIARRGIPEEIWCDNGSNFIGGNNELRKLRQGVINQQQNNLITEFLLQKAIKFHFNPPRAPNFGGLWEASVKSVKYHLKRVINASFTFEEMTTVIIQIESLLNSRPLCRMDDDPTNLQVLTPGHFLIGEPLTTIPEPTLDDVPINKLYKWQNLQMRVQGFFKCWSRDYLTTLQHRYKWKTKNEQLIADDVVLIKEDHLSPNQWLLGRVVNVHPGNDGIIRVVTLRTAHNEVKRPVSKLIKLPVKEH